MSSLNLSALQHSVLLQHYPHFAQRLQERYGQAITLRQYKLLCIRGKLRHRRLRPSTRGTYISCHEGYLKYRGYLLKVRSKPYKKAAINPLLTVIPLSVKDVEYLIKMGSIKIPP